MDSDINILLSEQRVKFDEELYNKDVEIAKLTRRLNELLESTKESDQTNG